MQTVLITGGAGFFGEILTRHFLREGFFCVSIDLVPDGNRHPRLTSIQGDIRDLALLERIFQTWTFDAIYHCAAILAHAVKDKKFLWSSNVDGTLNIAELAKKYRVPKVIYTSSNCLWGKSFGRPVTEEDAPHPVEIYGRSKWQAEKILLGFADWFDVIIFRCPTIIDAGWLGLLAILFEFIEEGRRVWVVGGGKNRYQFICARDLSDACLRALRHDGSAVFNIGSDHVKPLREVYAWVIRKAGTRARVASLPRAPTLGLMKIAYALGLSPLGPYQYRMMAQDFSFDTRKVKHGLGWSPTRTNEEMLWDAYRYYRDHRDEIRRRLGASAHRQPAKMGIIRLLKWLS